MNWKVPLSDIDLTEEEIQAVVEVLRSRWLSQGEITKKFENKFAEYLGVKYAFAVANGTAALHLACTAVGLSRDSQVILPSLTFVATANAVLYTQATPVFADVISLNNLTISPREIKKKINPQTRAIIVMHYGGYVCKMPEILDIAHRHNLRVIEDAAHAPGATLDGLKAGAFGDLACFSFFANKNLVTGEGGMVVTNQDDLAEKIRLMRSHGMTSLTWDRHRGHASSYDVVTLGYNYRMDEIRSALGLIQLEKLEKNNHARRRISQVYAEAFMEQPDLLVPFWPEHRGISSAHLFVIQLKNWKSRQEFQAHLKNHGIQSSLHYPPVHQFSLYSDSLAFQRENLSNTELAGKSLVTLPLFPTMSDQQIEAVIQAVKNFFA